MTDLSDDIPHSTSMASNVRLGPAFLIYFHIVVCCLSLIYVAEFYANLKIVMFDQSRLYAAALNVAPFALASILFAFSRFSFGYFLGFYFYTMILGYLWLVDFSRFQLRSRIGDHFSFWLRPRIPRARAVHHVADQAKVHPVDAGAGESAVLSS